MQKIRIPIPARAIKLTYLSVKWGPSCWTKIGKVVVPSPTLGVVANEKEGAGAPSSTVGHGCFLVTSISLPNAYFTIYHRIYLMCVSQLIFINNTAIFPRCQSNKQYRLLHFTILAIFQPTWLWPCQQSVVIVEWRCRRGRAHLRRRSRSNAKFICKRKSQLYHL